MNPRTVLSALLYISLCCGSSNVYEYYPIEARLSLSASRTPFIFCWFRVFPAGGFEGGVALDTEWTSHCEDTLGLGGLRFVTQKCTRGKVEFVVDSERLLVTPRKDTQHLFFLKKGSHNKEVVNGYTECSFVLSGAKVLAALAGLVLVLLT